MKLFAFIMALLVLTLSCMPCADEALPGEKANTALSKACSNSDDHTDDCSPFCTCNCCAGFTINVSFLQITGSISTVVAKNKIHLPERISNVSLPIWQPPQLV